MPKFTQLVRKLNQDTNSALFDPIAQHTLYTENFDQCNKHYHVPTKAEHGHCSHEHTCVEVNIQRNVMNRRIHSLGN